MHTDLSDLTLWIALAVLLFVSGFFSASETGMMSLNRFKLRHLARGKKSATPKMVQEMLKMPDRLLGTILVGNTFANICAASIATFLAVKYFGEYGVALSTFLTTIVLLIFAEVTPKTLAAFHPERTAFFVVWPLRVMILVFYPLVWFVSSIATGLLSIFGIKRRDLSADTLSHDELRTVLEASNNAISSSNRLMLTRVLDLREITVDDIMVPRSEVMALDLDDEWSIIEEQIHTSQLTRLPVYAGDINNLKGVVHLRDVLYEMQHEDFNLDSLKAIIKEPYYIPQGTPLTTQLVNFQQNKVRIGFVVDEYGDMQGLVTLDDILEEIVGEFTTDMSARSKDVYPQDDGCYLVDGAANIRELNRVMNWHLPTDGPKTLSGLITEYLEMIPEEGLCFRLSGYPMEVVQVKNNIIKAVRIMPHLRQV